MVIQYEKEFYSQFKNNCNIISYHGITDDFVSNFEKKNFCSRLNKCKYIEITQDEVDNIIFKSTNHSLDADLLKLFDHAMCSIGNKFEKDNILDLTNNVEFKTYKQKYVIDYSNVIPTINIL